MTDTSFCTKCGARVSEEAMFCPACGMPIEGRANPAYGGLTAQQYMEKELISSKIRFVTMMLLIYAIPVLISGIYALLRVDQLTSILIADDMIKEAMAQYNLTEADISAALTYGGAMITASGALTLVSAYCVYKQKYWFAAVICTAAASFLCIMSIFGMIIGLLVTWSIVSLRPVFDKPEEQAQ